MISSELAVPLLTAAIGALLSAGGYSLLIVRKLGEHTSSIKTLFTNADASEIRLEKRFETVRSMATMQIDQMGKLIDQNTQLIAEIRAERNHRRMDQS